MPARKYIVELDASERERLNDLISRGKAPAKAILKARILLKADQGESGPGWRDAQIVEALDTNLSMVMRVREKLVNEGLDAVFTRKKRPTPPTPPIFDGEAEARLTALACSAPPQGHARWTIRLLAEHVVTRGIVPAVHFNTVGRALKKRHQTAPDRLLGDPAEGQCRLRRRDGGRARCLHAATRPGVPAGLP
jgi:hypothetical protein